MSMMTLPQLKLLEAAAPFRGWEHSWSEIGNTLSCSGFGVEGLGPWGVHRDHLSVGDLSELYIYADGNHSPWAPPLRAAHIILNDRERVVTPSFIGPTMPWRGTVNFCQGWRGLELPVDGDDDRGHTFFWLSHWKRPWLGWMVSSTTKRATDGTNGTQVEGDEPVSLAQAIDEHGIPTEAWPEPMEWPTYRYVKGIAFLELP